ncbi:MAG: aminoacyl--tRNA ligase-related protein, partial [Patescibacteria group bacterium]
MRQSKLFTKTQREAPKDEVSLNAQLLIRAGFVDKLMAGVYTYLPLGLRVLDKIKNIIREEINAVGGQEILMPALNPKENWVKTGRWDGLDVLFRLEGAGGKEYALGASHEEVVTPLVQRFANSYKDLPVAVYQIQDKFRNEPRAKSGLLRGREFSMKDLYSFHANEKDLDGYYEKVKAAYLKIYERCGLGPLTHVVFASGGTFSKYSHEFQTITEYGEDTIFVCSKCGTGVNKEIIDEQKTCPECGNEKLEEKKSIEVGNIFKLKTKYSAAFDYKYTDEKGEKQIVTMGCYGIGPSRVLGTIVEVHHDDGGIIWPESVAPFQIHL